MNVTVFMGKLVVAAAFAVFLFWTSGARADLDVLYTEVDLHDDGSSTTHYTYIETDTLDTFILHVHRDKDDKWQAVGFEFEGNPTPDSDDPYADDKPPYMVGGKSPLAPGGWVEEIEPKFAKYTEEGFQIEKGMGLFDL